MAPAAMIVQVFFCKKVLNLSDYETSLRSALTVHSKLVSVAPALGLH